MIRRFLEDSQPIREVATGFGVNECMAHKWLAHYRVEGQRAGQPLLSSHDSRQTNRRTLDQRD
ncbi:hypothetical protein JO965_26280 (plasmid) [Microvirga sp. VF16]|nr:hypothetical protein JO965_26280 [Microvirga sp. VF16]